ncbi:hypothetical protein TeGR_g14561 [Tetraparma gracilis]|uniref:Uncharacterized protein n=1 Tax=Tetraparma gracilis TaxID=2962635 RepID=A0ABQ6N3E7_9STRA|nr:hypothetical protein TeGR_g14561 [Tetraparma gracilis]
MGICYAGHYTFGTIEEKNWTFMGEERYATLTFELEKFDEEFASEIEKKAAPVVEEEEEEEVVEEEEEGGEEGGEAGEEEEEEEDFGRRWITRVKTKTNYENNAEVEYLFDNEWRAAVVRWKNADGTYDLKDGNYKLRRITTEDIRLIAKETSQAAQTKAGRLSGKRARDADDNGGGSDSQIVKQEAPAEPRPVTPTEEEAFLTEEFKMLEEGARRSDARMKADQS